jgi:hypothetical protein
MAGIWERYRRNPVREALIREQEAESIIRPGHGRRRHGKAASMPSPGRVLLGLIILAVAAYAFL